MKKITLILLPVLFIILCISCYKNESPKAGVEKDKQVNRQSNFRNYEPISKKDYLQLSVADKKKAWVSKMEYILTTQALNSTQRTLIEQLIDNLEALTGANASPKLDETAKLLLEEFSETDFKKTFGSLQANTLSGTNTPINAKLVVTGGAFGAASDPTPVAGFCTCSWTCPNPYCATCTQTQRDCGFLNMHPCVGVRCADCKC